MCPFCWTRLQLTSNHFRSRADRSLPAFSATKEEDLRRSRINALARIRESNERKAEAARDAAVEKMRELEDAKEREKQCKAAVRETRRRAAKTARSAHAKRLADDEARASRGARIVAAKEKVAKESTSALRRVRPRSGCNSASTGDKQLGTRTIVREVSARHLRRV